MLSPGCALSSPAVPEGCPQPPCCAGGDADGFPPQSTKAVYERILDLRIATPQIVINYGLFLEEHGYFEESFKVTPQGVTWQGDTLGTRWGGDWGHVRDSLAMSTLWGQPGEETGDTRGTL